MKIDAIGNMNPHGGSIAKALSFLCLSVILQIHVLSEDI